MTPKTTSEALEREKFEDAWMNGVIERPEHQRKGYTAEDVERAEKDAAWEAWQVRAALHPEVASGYAQGWQDGSSETVAALHPPGHQPATAGAEPSDPEFGWLIENGKKAGDGLAYRFIDNDAGGLPGWTADPFKALRFARRADAEQFAHHDEDAWRIVEHGFHTALAASDHPDGEKVLFENAPSADSAKPAGEQPEPHRDYAAGFETRCRRLLALARSSNPLDGKAITARDLARLSEIALASAPAPAEPNDEDERPQTAVERRLRGMNPRLRARVEPASEAEAFEQLCREHGIAGTAAARQCEVFWRAGAAFASSHVCPHGIHYDNACGACVPPRGTK